MRKHAELSAKFLVPAVAHAALVHNAIGRPEENYVSPHETLTGEVPVIAEWHVFCDITAVNTTPVGKKTPKGRDKVRFCIYICLPEYNGNAGGTHRLNRDNTAAFFNPVTNRKIFTRN